MENTNQILEEKRKTLLRKAIVAIQDRGWLVWNPSQHGKNTIFDIASVPPKGNGSDEWDDDNTMIYKAITEDNLNEIGLCLDEVKDYVAVPIFIVESKDMAMKITALAKDSENKGWSLMVPGEPVKKEEKYKIQTALSETLERFRRLVYDIKESFKN